MCPAAEGMPRGPGDCGGGVLYRPGEGNERATPSQGFLESIGAPLGTSVVALLCWRKGGICLEAWPRIGTEGDWNMWAFEPLDHSYA